MKNSFCKLAVACLVLVLIAAEEKTKDLPPFEPGEAIFNGKDLSGWDKDADFHVASGRRVEPLPFHGLDDQKYGLEKRPPFPSDALHRKYNTRWVEGNVLKQAAKRASRERDL